MIIAGKTNGSPAQGRQDACGTYRRLSGGLAHALNTLLACALLAGCSLRKSRVPLTEALQHDRTEFDGIVCTMGAHRGDSELFTENTPRAIRSACKNPKYAFIEFDVQYCADDIPVVFHDGNLLRVFGHLHSVHDTPFNELQALSGNEIVTYDEIMDLAEDKHLNIEIKSQGDHEKDHQLIDFILADVQQRGIADRILISSISADAIKYVKDTYPETPTGQIFWIKASTYLPFDFLTEGLYDEINESKADYILLHTANRWNLRDLLRLKPEDKTLVFWDFGDTMYLVHKDSRDRLWGGSGLRSFFE